MIDLLYRRHQEEISEDKKQLLERLDKYKFFSKENYDLFLSILNLEVNVWNLNIPEEVFKIPDTIFADIVKFNLKNYMLCFLAKKVDKDIIWCNEFGGKCIINVVPYLKTASAVVCYDNNMEQRPRGELRLYKHIYDRNYNETRIEFMKKLLEQYKSSGRCDLLDARMLEIQIHRMEKFLNEKDSFVIWNTSGCTPEHFSDSNEILDILLKEYNVEFPELSIGDNLDYNTFRNVKLSSPVSLLTDLDNYGCKDDLVELFQKEWLSSTSCVQDDEKGKVYTVKYLHDIYKKDTD